MLYRRSKALQSLCFLVTVAMPALNIIYFLILYKDVDENAKGIRTKSKMPPLGFRDIIGRCE